MVNSSSIWEEGASFSILQKYLKIFPVLFMTFAGDWRLIKQRENNTDKERRMIKQGLYKKVNTKKKKASIAKREKIKKENLEVCVPLH